MRESETDRLTGGRQTDRRTDRQTLTDRDRQSGTDSQSVLRQENIRMITTRDLSCFHLSQTSLTFSELASATAPSFRIEFQLRSRSFTPSFTFCNQRQYKFKVIITTIIIIIIITIMISLFLKRFSV